MDSLKVGVSGVRGVVGKTMTPSIVAAFGQAFGDFVGRGKVVVGRDTRSSGPMIEDALIAGLQSVGCSPVQVGIAPTPSVLCYTREIRARGGIAITASHNPVEWNALKFVDRNGMFLDEVHCEELFDIYHQRSFSMVDESQLQPTEAVLDVTQNHFEKIRNYVDCTSIKNANLKVAVDCCNGVGSLFSKSFLEEFGCKVLTLHDTPSGYFERPPEPLPCHLKALSQVVTREKCDIGFAQDPDGDRLAVVDEKGRPIGENFSFGLAAVQVLIAHGNGPTVANLSISQALKDKMRELNSQLFLTATGEINVSAEVLRQGAVIGGEDTGGIIIPAIHPCRDSFAGMAVILELMARTGQSVSELMCMFPPYHLIKEKVPIRAEWAPGILRTIRAAFSGKPMQTIDGVYVQLDQGWFLVRRSNTEPVIRLLVEGKTPDFTASCAAELRSLIDSCTPDN